MPQGSVVSQTPASGPGHRGDPVTFVVSKGPVLVTIPTGLRGTGGDAAAARLQELGFQTRFERLVPGGFGLVLRTDPAEGSQAPRGSLVTIFVV